MPADSLPTPRPVNVTVRAIGYAPQERVVALRPGARVNLEAQLCPSVVTLAMAVATATGTQSITNTQHEGLDEGGIVKRHGEYLVILRRGRLFTVEVGRGRLRPVAVVDAYGPGLNPGSAWYDELLVAADKAVVIGYSYLRRATELGVFRISPAGELSHTGTYHLRSNDYYSSENYASRLIGSRLLLYAPLYFLGDTANPLAALPAMRRWKPSEGLSDTSGFEPIATARRIYRPLGRIDPGSLEALHTVTSCDLAAPELACESTVVLGGSGRVFYVSPSAVYVSATAWRREPWQPADASGDMAPRPSLMYRLPLDGRPPSALHTLGSPIDQFSFLEKDDYLNVVLRAHGRGDAMWNAEWPGGSLALLRIPLERFSDGTREAPRSAYRTLPVTDGGFSIQNRFVGEHLLYGAGNSWWSPRALTPTLFVVPVRGGIISGIQMPHGVDRIEVLGPDALVVGSDTANLHFTAVRLERSPRLAQRYVLSQASQGELRSHGFFYRPDTGRPVTGTLGLPVSRPGRPGYKHLLEGSASVVFLRNDGDAFRPLGELTPHLDRVAEDDCRASCVDWYGNARPLFFEGRILALLGYELVEGRMRAGRITERRRVSFAPKVPVERKSH